MPIAILICGLALSWRLETSTWQVLWIERWAITGALIAVWSLWRSQIQSRSLKLILSYLIMLLCYNSAQLEPAQMLPVKLAQMDQFWILLVFIMFLQSRINLTRALYWGSLAQLLCCLLPGAQWEVPLIHNPSMAAVFVVLASGVAWWSVIAVIACHSWTAFGALIAGLTWRYKHKLKWWHGLFIPWWALALYRHGIPDNGRFTIWKHYTQIWWTSGWEPRLVGAGPGTSCVWLEWLARAGKLGDPFVERFLHNDWLQALVELGLVGLILALLSGVSLFRKARLEQQVLFVACSVSALSDFPWHYPATALVLWNLISQVDSRKA